MTKNKSPKEKNSQKDQRRIDKDKEALVAFIAKNYETMTGNPPFVTDFEEGLKNLSFKELDNFKKILEKEQKARQQLEKIEKKRRSTYNPHPRQG